MSFDRIILSLSAAFVLLGGVSCLVAPAPFAAQAGLSPTPDGLTEIRAFYGGLEIGLGCFLIWCFQRPTLTSAGLLLVGLTVGGVGTARVVGMIIDQAPTAFHLANLAVEVVTVALAGLAISRRPGHSEPQAP